MGVATPLKRDNFVAMPLGMAVIDLAFQKNAFDPLNPVKFWVLGVLAIWCFADMTTGKARRQLSTLNGFKTLLVILGIFVFGCLLAFLFTDVQTIGLLGDTGRTLGVLNYIFLAVIILYTAIKIDFFNVNFVYSSSEILLLLLSVYGIAQHFNHDFLKWQNKNSPVILMTGNPDFAASLLSILLILTFAHFLYEKDLTKRLRLLFTIILSLPAIYWTQARQGMISGVIGIGLLIAALAWGRNKKLGISLLSVEVVFGLISVLGMLQMGPFTKFLYKDSIRDRGYDWRAAISMFKSHPFTGVGFDRYGAYFSQYKSPHYPLIYGYQQTVTNAHNIFLQLFATGGIVLGLAYLGLVLFIGKQAITLFKSSSGKEQIFFTGIIAAWMAFVAQSFISVDCLVTSIWGWVLGGIIIGLSVQILSDAKGESLHQGRASFNGDLTTYRGLVFLGTIACFLLVVVPMYRNESNISKFISASAPQDSKYQAAYLAVAGSTFNQLFMSPNYKFQTALALIKNNYALQGIKYLELTTHADKRDLDSYLLLSRIYEDLHFINLPKAISVRQKIAMLDPYNAENLLSLESDYLLIKQKTQAQKLAMRIEKIAPNTDSAKTAAAILNK